MPIERTAISLSQFCELLGLDEQRFVGVVRLNSSTLTILQEPDDMAQTTGSFPQLAKGGKKSGGKGGRGC